MNSGCISKIEQTPTLRQLQQELWEKEKKLQEEIRKREYAEKANKQLLAKFEEHERLAIAGQLAAGIVHDFSNIMAVIVLTTQLLRRSVTLPFPAFRHLETIEQQAKLASGLVQQILGFCRQNIREKKTLNLRPFLTEMVNLLGHILPDNILVELSAGQDEYIVQADPNCIQQVIMNLAINARDSQPNGGSLQINLDRVHTKHNPGSNRVAKEWVRISVQDKGVGIHPDVLSQIFKPFFTTKPAGAGTGLGLTQVKRIIKQHDGYIEVQSEIDKGTNFHLYFPAHITPD